MLFKRYTKRLTILTYLLWFLCVSLLLAPMSIPVTISLWILSLSFIRGVCYLQSPFHNLLRNKKSGYTLHQFKNCSITCITCLPSPSASVAVNIDYHIVSNPSSPSVTCIVFFFSSVYFVSLIHNINIATSTSCWCHTEVTLTVDKPKKLCSNTSNMVWCRIIFVRQAF